MSRVQKFYFAFLLAWLLMIPVVLLEINKPVEQAWAQGGTTVFTSVRINRELRLQPRDAISLTMNASLNPTGSFQQVESAGAVSVSGASITVKPAGTILVLANIGANTITFTETGTLISAGNIALGANDSATLISDGTNWRQIGASNN